MASLDRVHHFNLYNSLLYAGIPVVIIDVLCNWYSKLSFAVRWNNVMLLVCLYMSAV